jgi:hypothetical protein
MALRIKTKWHQSKRPPRSKRRGGEKTMEDRAKVVAFNIWKIALESFKHMEKEGFKFQADMQIAAVLTELIAFLVQIADRMVYGKIGEDERQAFVTAMARQLAVNMQTNLSDVAGEIEYAGPFIDTLNARFRDYAEFDYGESGPGYGFVRYLGEQVSDAMAEGDNKWVIEHVMEIEVPDMLPPLRRSVGEVLGIKVN